MSGSDQTSDTRRQCSARPRKAPTNTSPPSCLRHDRADLSSSEITASLSAFLTWAIHPVLLRHVLANPNDRSSHRVPTPQGGGIALIGAAALIFVAGR